MTAGPTTAMVLAAGLGTRMRPLTDKLPKALVTVAGRTLLDRVLDKLAQAGVERAVVNVHHFADQVERHLQGRRAPRIALKIWPANPPLRIPRSMTKRTSLGSTGSPVE